MIVFKHLKQQHLHDLYQIAERTLEPVWAEKEYGYFIAHEAAWNFGAFCENDQLVGFVLSLKSGDDLDLVSIATDKSHWGRGIGGALLNQLIGTKGVRSITLEVDPNNERAIKLYLKAGFEVVGIRKKYYQGKKDAWLMRKQI